MFSVRISRKRLLKIWIAIKIMGTCFQAITKGAFKMITFFTKFLFKNKFKEGQNSRHLYGILSGIIGITLNLLLFTAKLLVGFITKSISITADAFNNLSDAASSIITIIGFKLANQKPDKDHPFGHGRIEYLTGLFVSIAILLMSYELFRSSIKKIIHPESIEYSPIIIAYIIQKRLIKFAYMSKKDEMCYDIIKQGGFDTYFDYYETLLTMSDEELQAKYIETYTALNNTAEQVSSIDNNIGLMGTIGSGILKED